MAQEPIPWQNVVVRYCPHCKLVHPAGAECCKQCGRKLVDQIRREKLEDR